jgi:hypothetical protein
VIYQHACRRFGARRVAQWQYPLIYFTRRGDDCTRWISDKHEGDTLEDPVEDGAPGLSVRALASLMGDMGEPGEAVVVVGSEALRETVGRRGGRFVKAESNSEGAGAGECQADESGDAA